MNIDKAVASMVSWCEEETQNDIRIIKDDEMMWTPDYLSNEKKKGNAKVTLLFPRWMVNAGYVVIKEILGENEKTYLLNKAVHPLRSK